MFTGLFSVSRKSFLVAIKLFEKKSTVGRTGVPKRTRGYSMRDLCAGVVVPEWEKGQ